MSSYTKVVPFTPSKKGKDTTSVSPSSSTLVDKSEHHHKNDLSIHAAANMKAKLHRIHENVKLEVMKEAHKTIEIWAFRLRMFGMAVFIVLVAYDLILALDSQIIRVETDPEVCCDSVCTNDPNLQSCTVTPQLYRNLFRIYGGLPGCGLGCVSTESEALDSEGNDCDMYLNNTHLCGMKDDEDFSSESMCCACGGGISSDIADSSPPHICDSEPFYNTAIPIFSLSTCSRKDSLTEFETFAEPYLDMSVLELCLKDSLRTTADQTMQARIANFASKCIVGGLYPLNANKNTRLLQPLSSRFIVSSSSSGNPALQELFADYINVNTDDALKQYSGEILNGLLKLLTLQYNRIKPMMESMSDILNSESPESIKGRADVVAAWDGIQHMLHSEREKIIAEQNFFFPILPACEIQIGPEIDTNFPPQMSGGPFNCNPHFSDLGSIIATMSTNMLTVTKRTLIKIEQRRTGATAGNVDKITCEDACLNLNPQQCEILDSPEIIDIAFRVIGFAAALSFVISFFDGYILLEYIKRRHGLEFLVHTDEGNFLGGKVLLK